MERPTPPGFDAYYKAMCGTVDDRRAMYERQKQFAREAKLWRASQGMEYKSFSGNKEYRRNGNGNAPTHMEAMQALASLKSAPIKILQDWEILRP
jgi:hypothetical protein